MELFKKISAAAVTAAMVVSFAGCGGDQSWSYKTDAASLTAGTYIYNLLNAYYEGMDLVESPDEAEKILEEEVEDSDGNKKTLEQYSYDSAEEASLRMLAIEQIMKDNDIAFDEVEYQTALSYASQVWPNIKAQFEEYGISQDSFNYCYAEYNVKFGQVFEYVYGPDGEEYVTDDELVNYFKDNYTGYAYFTLTMAETDEEGNTVAKSDEEFVKADSKFAEYVDAINKGGKDYKEVVKAYTDDYELTTDPTMSGTVNLSDNSINESVAEALGKLKDGEATYITTGEDATTCYYFVYRPKIDTLVDFLEEEDASTATEDTADLVSELTATEDTAEDSVYIYDLKSGFNHYTILDEMKGEAFLDYLLDYAKTIDYSKNPDVINKFKPKMFVD